MLICSWKVGLTVDEQSLKTCRQGIRSEARYVRSNDKSLTEGTGVLETLMLIATFGALFCTEFEQIFLICGLFTCLTVSIGVIWSDMITLPSAFRNSFHVWLLNRFCSLRALHGTRTFRDTRRSPDV
jgi:hypothetical protein